MGRPNLIEANGLGPRVLTMATTMGVRRIAETLRNEGYNLSFSAVKRYLDANTEERQEATEQVRVAVGAELQRTALTDVQRLDDLMNMTMEAIRGAPATDRLSKEWAGLIGQARGLIETRLKIAGAGGEEGGDKPMQVVISIPEGARHGTG